MSLTERQKGFNEGIQRAVGAINLAYGGNRAIMPARLTATMDALLEGMHKPPKPVAFEVTKVLGCPAVLDEGIQVLHCNGIADHDGAHFYQGPGWRKEWRT